MPRYNPDYLPHPHTHELSELSKDEPLPVEFHEFYATYGQPINATPLEEFVNGEFASYKHINKCGMIGSVEAENLRMVLWRSTHRLDDNNLRNTNVHDALFIFDPATGIDHHEVLSVTRTFKLPGPYTPGHNIVTLVTKDSQTGRPKWLQIPTTGYSTLVEGGCYYPIREIIP